LELDILTTPEEYKKINSSSLRKKRAAMKNPHFYWPKAVLPYQFLSNQGFTYKHTTEIFNAMKEWQKKTCLRFEPFTRGLAKKLGHNNRIVIQKGNGCFSYVGMRGWGGQPLGLATGCRVKKVVLHELGHAMGLYHEQNRPDRDDYVTILEGAFHDQANDKRYNTNITNLH
jgi:hypothetical protein